MHSFGNPLAVIAALLGGISVIGGGFFLFFWRISVVYQLDWKIRTIILLAAGVFLLFVGSFFVGRLPGAFFESISSGILRGVYCIWMICLVLLVQHILSIRFTPPAWTVSLAMILLLAYGFVMGSWTKVTEITITNKNIPHNINVVFISDLHVEHIHGTAYIQRIVDRINDLNPDFVVIGGDLMNIAKPSYAKSFLPFNKLKMPVYATLGNHDSMGDSGAIQAIFAESSLIPLRNQSVEEQGIQLVGIDDRSYWNNKTLTGILEESQIQSGFFTILISHQPQHLSKLSAFPIDLELAGHTHNGQFIPMKWLIRLFNDYSYGRYDLGTRTAFVSQGVGTWGAPIRIGTQSEIILLHLQK